jgi:naphthalene 1,2-dioxygenase system ferredoxin subunit
MAATPRYGEDAYARAVNRLQPSAAVCFQRPLNSRGVIDMTDSEWIRIASATEVAEAGGLLGRTIRGVPVAVYQVGGAWFATLDECTHGQARLSDGYLDGFLIECPFHQGLFDVRTGEAVGPPCTQPLPTIAVRREGDDLLVSLTSLQKT